jgi:hypothetical protein
VDRRGKLAAAAHFPFFLSCRHAVYLNGDVEIFYGFRSVWPSLKCNKSPCFIEILGKFIGDGVHK